MPVQWIGPEHFLSEAGGRVQGLLQIPEQLGGTQGGWLSSSQARVLPVQGPPVPFPPKVHALCDSRQEGQRLIVAIQPQSHQLSEGSGMKLSLVDYPTERETGLAVRVVSSPTCHLVPFLTGA